MKTKDWSSNAGKALLLLMLFALPMLSGCTVLGFGVGWLADSGSEYFEDVPLSNGLGELDAGDTVMCVKKRGTIVAGTYAGMGVSGEDGLLERVTYFRVRTGEVIEEIDTSTIRSLRFERTPWTARTVLTLLGLATDAFVMISVASNWKIKQPG